MYCCHLPTILCFFWPIPLDDSVKCTSGLFINIKIVPRWLRVAFDICVKQVMKFSETYQHLKNTLYRAYSLSAWFAFSRLFLNDEWIALVKFVRVEKKGRQNVFSVVTSSGNVYLCVLDWTFLGATGLQTLV